MSYLVCEIIEYRDGRLFWTQNRGPRVRTGKEAGTYDGSSGYYRVRVLGKTRLVHHVVWFLHHGYWPTRLDHIDRNKLNNRIENLRECTRSQNRYNYALPVTNYSGFKGVNWHKASGKWSARVQAKGVRLDLGGFGCILDAATAYNFAAALYHGEFAYYNTVPQPWLEGKVHV